MRAHTGIRYLDRQGAALGADLRQLELELMSKLRLVVGIGLCMVLSGCVIGKHPGWEHLDGYLTLELLVGSAEHKPHSTGSDLLEYAVMAKNLPDSRSFRHH